ncbi:glycoside hydrolase family 5 protein [Desulforhopalus sp. IMCC35007]|uniref:glycoside hydrolase family 5 protein n=1 Tax=Desulforhopalus sp. IMCC35007 TaxID=2569543 RepID=UPI0010ADEB54|nr:cellulase family glycosylhydrolase [Desulforhopalus sp. IMCC35007]TKB05670.1 glycoside hydrolase family 5 protein [Desulforhopalus sp. IMCC35007]
MSQETAYKEFARLNELITGKKTNAFGSGAIATRILELALFIRYQGTAPTQRRRPHLIKALLLVLWLVSPLTVIAANPMVHQDGSRIVDGEGKPVVLRGVLIEGWLMWNGPMWGAGIFSSETHIVNKLTALVGAEEVEKFQKEIYQNFISERDIRMIADMGFNVVRVPFNHTILEDDDRPFQYKTSGWELLDRLLDWCQNNRVYVVLDLHSAPGGQSEVFVNDPDGSGFYTSESNLKRTVALWQAIAHRYKNRNIIAGYDLLNEPQLPLFTPGSVLVDVYRRIIEAIRKVDTQHMVILSAGGFTSNDSSMFTEVLDDNQALAFHTYNLLSSDINYEEQKKHSELSRKLNVPILNGEIGAHTLEWVSQVINMFEDPKYNVSGWIYWPWKRVPEQGKRWRHLMAIETPPEWDLVRNWVAGVWFAPKPSPGQTIAGMRAFVEAGKAENIRLDQEMAAVLTRFRMENKNKDNR